MKTDGELVLVAADPTAYRELARFRIADRTCRALPALCRARLLVRDTETLRCYDLSP